MTFNESFNREAKKLMDETIQLLEKREWDHGQAGNEDVRIALREVRLAFIEVSLGLAKSE